MLRSGGGSSESESKPKLERGPSGFTVAGPIDHDGDGIEDTLLQKENQKYLLQLYKMGQQIRKKSVLVI